MAMEVPKPGLSEDEKKKLFDLKPLKYYRPPLRSDPRNFIQKISQLSLEAQCYHNSLSGNQDWRIPPESVITDAESTQNCSSGACSSLNRSNTRSAQSRLQPNNDLNISFPPTRDLSVGDGNGKYTFKEKNRSANLHSHVNHGGLESTAALNLGIQPPNVPLKSSPLNNLDKDSSLFIQKTSLKSSYQSVSGYQELRSNSQTELYGDSEDKRITKTHSVSGSVHGRERDFVSSTRHGQNWRLSTCHSKSQDWKSGLDLSQKTHRSSTPLPMSDDSNDVSSQNSSRTCNLKTPDRVQQDERSTQSAVSYISDDSKLAKGFTFDSISTIPVGEHSCQYTPNMDRTISPSESSSGVSSLNQTTENVSSSSLRSISPESLSSVSIAGSGALSLAGDDEKNDFCMRQSEEFSSLDSSLNLGSGYENEVLGSWKASFSVTSSDKPRKSHLNYDPSEAPTHLSRSWDSPSESAMSSMGLPTTFGASKALKRKAFETPHTDPGVEETVFKCFSKRFTFEPSEWNLPDASSIFSSKPWELPDFLELKQKLNAVKDELNDLVLQDWHAHTRKRNKAGNVMWQLRNKIDPEFPTQAWCKFYENVASFPLVPQKAIDKNCLNSVHLCEAPGAFITSLNHYLHVNHGKDFKFDWRAVTLNPYYEGNPLSCMINDDRLILKTLDKWLFGEDNTGDLMSQKNIIRIMQDASELGEILLITADGSFDCQDNPCEQEDSVSWLHYCECVAALQMLAPGGSLLVKMFTFYEHASICLMYLLNCVFEEVTVNKPVTSKEGNSEVYVVCIGYRGSSLFEPHLKVLMENYGLHSPGKALFPLEKIPTDFLEQLFKCADFYRKMQSDVIMENVRSFHNPARRDSHRTVSIRHRVATTFFSKYRLQKLDRDLYLVDKRKLKDATTLNLDPKAEEGSFNDRRKRMEVSVVEELKYLEDDLRYLNVAWPGDFDVFWLDFPDNPKGFRIVKGKPVTKVNSSKFCLGRLLKIRNRVRDIAHTYYQVQISHGSTFSDTREFPWPDEDEQLVKRKVTTLDFKNKLWSSLEDGNNTVNEKDACKKILSAVENQVFRDDCLELRGYPLLTQFNVGLVFLVGHLFEKVGFVRPAGQDIRVLFYKYQKFQPQMKHHWDEVVSVMEHDSEAVLSVVQVSELSDGDFYRYVTEINNLCVVEQIQDLLKAMSQKA